MAKKKVVEEVKEEQVTQEVKKDDSEAKPVEPKEAVESEGEESLEADGEDDKKTGKKGTRGEIRLFNRWSFDGVKVNDPSLVKYINITPIIIPHSGGKHEHKKFWKTEHISVVERFINKLMSPGLVRRKIKGRGSAWNAGKKQKILKIVENALAMVEETSGENPIQMLINAITNAAPREETTRISLGGISYQTSVDIAPQRRVDLGIRLLVQTSVGGTYSNIKTIDECLATEIYLAAIMDQNSKAVKRRDELERIAISAR
jgi:small subunit ribosomal protein S7